MWLIGSEVKSASEKRVDDVFDDDDDDDDDGNS